MAFNILISGVGGQGTVLASKLIAGAAIKSGLPVRTTETIGMAQRGGCVVGHTRIGSINETIHSPLILQGKADLLLAFEPSEAVRNLHFLSPEGMLVVCKSIVKPITDTEGKYKADDLIEHIKANVKKHIIIDGERILKNYSKMLNVALLGAATQSGVFPFGTEVLKETISEMPKFAKENLEAFDLGRELYNESAK